MANYLKFSADDQANTAVVSMLYGSQGDIPKDGGNGISRKLLHTAKVLPEGSFIGCQIASDQNDDPYSFLFTSSDLKITQSDYQWIFDSWECNIEDADPSRGLKSLFEGNRRVYQLQSVDDVDESIDRVDIYSLWESLSVNRFQDVFCQLLKDGAVIQVIECGIGKTGAGHGTVLISMPVELSFRMQVHLSMIFCNMKTVEITEDSEMEFLPDELLYDSVAIIMSSVIEEARKKPKDRDRNDIPIEDLEFSIRTFNCLKRAGINTMKQVMELTDEELMSVRNLGRKGFDEVRRKQCEWEKEFAEEEAGNPEDDAGNPEDDAGKPEEGAGKPEEDAGKPEEGAGNPDEGVGNPEENAEDPVDAPKEDSAENEPGSEDTGNDSSVKDSSETEDIPDAPVESPMDKLDQMIGLSDVKKQVRKIAAFARMKKDMEARGQGSLSAVMNMAFLGSPGTGKTTAARIIAGIFHEIGVISGSDVLEVGRADLVGKYVGHTARRVKEIFKEAKGKVLFIDEAYSLADGASGSFGDEAIDTLVQEMENHRDETIVILAGYPDKMEEFLSRNPGLRSRVPFSIRFEDYSVEEMIQIIGKDAEKRGFSIDPEAKAPMISLCEQETREKERGNGRFCRNVVDDAILNYALRVYGGSETEDLNPERLFELTEADFREVELSQKNKVAEKGSEKVKIGFCA